MACHLDTLRLLHQAAPRLAPRLFPGSRCVRPVGCIQQRLGSASPPSSNSRAYSQETRTYAQVRRLNVPTPRSTLQRPNPSVTTPPAWLPAAKPSVPHIRTFTHLHESEAIKQLRKILKRQPDITPEKLRYYDLRNRLQSLASSHLASMSYGGHAKPRRNFFPLASSRAVGIWLYISAASVFGIVIFGGLTRMTESGLSITEWRPVTGSLPPLSAEAWDEEFEKYKASPEYKMLNASMQMGEFKKIYYMEYLHRLWGRVIGLSFVIPGVYFVARRQASKPVSLTLLGISLLIGAQGFMGWYMVKSGLTDDLFEPGSHPRVSQYRLTSHLTVAFTIFSTMLWTAMRISQYERTVGMDGKVKGAPMATNQLLVSQLLKNPGYRWLRRSMAGMLSIIFITAMAGGMVAGLDAGMVYNDFPKMTASSWLPPTNELWSDFYSRRADKSDLWWRNMLENPATVQMDHRILATTTFTVVCLLWCVARFNRRFKFAGTAQQMQQAAKRVIQSPMNQTFYMVWVQVSLGITTLWYMCPIPLASLHQAGALALLSCALLSARRIFPPRVFARQAIDEKSMQRLMSLLSTAKRSPAAKRHINHSKKAALPTEAAKPVKAIDSQIPSVAV